MRRKNWGKVVSVMTLAALTAMTAACAAEGAADKDLSERVDLVMYLLGDEPPRYEAVLEEFNEMALEELNCTLDVKFLDWGEYETQYPLLFSSGEKFDLAYAATWVDFMNLAQKGAFMPLEDLLPQYCAESLKSCPDEALEQATINGHTYAYPTNFATYNAYGCVVRGDMMDKYGFESISNYEEYGEFLKAVKENEPSFTNVAGMNYNPSLMANIYLEAHDLYPLNGGQFGIYYLDLSDGEDQAKVIAMHEWDGYEAYCDMVKEWADYGLWPKSVMSVTDSVESLLQSGAAAAYMSNLDGWATSYALVDSSWDLRWYNLIPTVNHLNYIQDCMVIPTSSEHPERALMLLDKLRTDERYYNLLTYGVEGVDFTKNDDGTFTAIDMNSFTPEPGTWGFRTKEYFMNADTYPADIDDRRAELESQVVSNMFRGFNMDTEPVKTEFAAMQSVYTQYNTPLVGGITSDVNDDLQQLAQKAEAAGNEKVKAELQAQVDAFYAEHKQ